MIQIDLRGKTAIITGASQGLEEETARVLHEAGANITINYFDDTKGVNHPPAKQVAWGLRPHRGLTVLQKPPNLGNKVQGLVVASQLLGKSGRTAGRAEERSRHHAASGEALPEPPPQEAAFALVNKVPGS